MWSLFYFLLYAANPPTAETLNGTYRGEYLPEYQQDLFLGIPFARPPLEHRRFANPESLNTAWTGARPATKYAFECIGYGGGQKGYLQSEDCLYLNVIRPSGYQNDSLPVLVWIHGGGFKEGGTPDKRYNLTFIVNNSAVINEPIIAVSLAYRLGPFGFLNGDEVAASGALNLGLKDQRLALHWIRENIAGLGGDPDKITIYGQSAGSESVGYHLRAFNGRDDKLFQAFDGIVAAAGCGSDQNSTKLDCLRDLPFATLNNILNTTTYNTGWEPTIDGDFVARYPSEQLEAGAFVHVPIIAGTTTDEGTTQCPKPVNTSLELRAWMTETSSYQLALNDTIATRLLTLYPNTTTFGIPSTEELGDTNITFPQPYGASFRQTAAYYGDQVFIASRRRTCEVWAARGIPAYCYRFNTKPAGLAWEVGVEHFSDVAFIFNNLAGEGYDPSPFAGMPASYAELSYLMAGSWASFVTSLDPNAWHGRGRNATRDGVQWPVYRVEAPEIVVWDANVTTFVERDDWRKEGIRLIQSLALEYGR
ncbi:hypothetical protein ASPACDRAFT_50157 [Aspergillus aculeatus ATCC 16872]|uniref:Carboxylesterase type B domain-containing protein n=1 Tax=Aspergillus aculeatus (strain ATCC 16872 / CBS 172.66 / WB 5094) TaxID=690307 RepID=A0A1L9X2R2_ASPA1|nr:uncharacterized protein ASPACDRAFT_50157 [Aspergillus aculeatus ATCC 16872]OJK02599.1 hypothetical protein ASPACDRAFT_50157 [Aspergillus aculeatus ATCC 16872]